MKEQSYRSASRVGRLSHAGPTKLGSRILLTAIGDSVVPGSEATPIQKPLLESRSPHVKMDGKNLPDGRLSSGGGRSFWAAGSPSSPEVRRKSCTGVRSTVLDQSSVSKLPEDGNKTNKAALFSGDMTALTNPKGYQDSEHFPVFLRGWCSRLAFKAVRTKVASQIALASKQNCFVAVRCQSVLQSVPAYTDAYNPVRTLAKWFCLETTRLLLLPDLITCRHQFLGLPHRLRQ